MEILHISAECYPVAKAGGLGDVVGALPKYQQRLGHIAKVIMPMYKTPFLYNNGFEVVHKNVFNFDGNNVDYTVIKEQTNKLDFDLYLIDINGVLDRENPYGYDDDTKRFLMFQIAVVDWLNYWEHQPDIVHCHDHHAGLLPFMMKYCKKYQQKLSNIKTIFTIHNGQYQGWMAWDNQKLLPEWDAFQWGKLDWDDMINPLASAVKCADRITTVSEGYLQELMIDCNGLEKLFQLEKNKCFGIVNGIDTEVWNPATDTYILDNFGTDDVNEGKYLNKKQLCDEYQLDINLPLFVFIGRLVGEKAADILPQSFINAYQILGNCFNILILGSGEKKVEQELEWVASTYWKNVKIAVGYNEKLSHKMYAGADFLLMPSRVEPCGLNQLYALKYGTIPLVRKTGGLSDTILDMGEQGGFGISFKNASSEDIVHSINRASQMYFNNPDHLKIIRQQIMNINHSWENSAQKYIDIYNS